MEFDKVTFLCESILLKVIRLKIVHCILTVIKKKS